MCKNTNSEKKKQNKDLKDFYDKVYAKGDSKHYSKLLFEVGKIPLEEREVLGELDWRNKDVLDFGCGTGLLSYEIAKSGANRVVGLDYSKQAIDEANKKFEHPALSFLNQDIKDYKDKYDIVVSLGVLEHMDKPFETLKSIKKLLKPGGVILVTCPNWVNPRGYVLMTLFKLFDAKITLADLHYLTPVEFEKWSSKMKMSFSWRTFDNDWSCGERLIKDFEKRLPNVLRDSNLPCEKKKINEFIVWVKGHVLPFEHKTKSSGAIGLYLFR